MTTIHFLLIAIVVFSLMLIGIVLTIREFKQALKLERETHHKSTQRDNNS
jgi:hypothetical protein